MKMIKVLVGIIIILSIFLAVRSRMTDKPGYPTENKPETQEKSLECDYFKAEIKAYQTGTDKLIDSKVVDACFTIFRGDMGLIEITSEQSNLKISYYEESDPKVLRFLDVRIGDDEPSRWRENKGYDLFIVDNKDALTLIFGDRKESKVKGTIKLTK